MWSSQNSVLLSMGMTFFVDFNNPPPPASSSFISILCLDFFFVWLPDLCVSIHVLESIFLMFAKLKYFILKLASDDLRGQRGHTFWGRWKINWMASISLRGHGGQCHKEKCQLCRSNVVDLYRPTFFKPIFVIFQHFVCGFTYFIPPGRVAAIGKPLRR